MESESNIITDRQALVFMIVSSVAILIYLIVGRSANGPDSFSNPVYLFAFIVTIFSGLYATVSLLRN